MGQKRLEEKDFKSRDKTNWEIACLFYAVRLLERWFQRIDECRESKFDVLERVRVWVGLPRNVKDLKEEDKPNYSYMKQYIADFMNRRILE